MPTWNGTRKKLETDYLCPALRGRVRYFYFLRMETEGLNLQKEKEVC